MFNQDQNYKRFTIGVSFEHHKFNTLYLLSIKTVLEKDKNSSLELEMKSIYMGHQDNYSYRRITLSLP